jgi:hypothetical protein
MHIFRIAYICVFMLSSLIPLYAKDQEKLRVAIMDFSGEDVTAGDAKKVSDLIRTEMINTGQYTIIERNEMGKILKEQGFSMTGCTDVSCAVQAGKLLSARKMMVGTVMKLDESLVINGRIIDVERGTADFAQKEISQSRKDLVRAVDAFVNRITLRIAPKGYAKQYADYESTIDPRKKAATYGWTSLSFLLLSLVGSGITIYADQMARQTEDAITWSQSSPSILKNSRMKRKEDDLKKYKLMRLYTGISTGAVGAVMLGTGITWLVYLFDKKSVGMNGDIHIDSTCSVILPTHYYNDCLNFTKKSQYGFGLGLSMKF